jgi:hypothetical protein
VDTPLLENPLETGSLKKEFDKDPAGSPATVEEIVDEIVFLASRMHSLHVRYRTERGWWVFTLVHSSLEIA